ncbi:MAG: hypothetical protein IJZ77_01390 [Bacilli bacterium]|nr:hypothetical protein [Bacilli bacterium]
MEKIKYLDMENATLRLQLNTIDEYEKFFKQHCEALTDLNFKRIYVKISSNYLKELLNTLQSVKLPIIIETDLFEDLTIDVPYSIIGIKTNSNLQINGNNVYNQVILNESNLEKVISLVNVDANVIIEPEVDVKNIFKINDCLKTLFQRVPNKLLNIGNYIVPTSLLKEHPCNCYLCDGWKCHKKISGLPKVILIDKDYNLYPHMITNDKLYIGNIKNSNFQDLLSNYLNSKEYQAFINCCKRVFIEYLPNYPFQYFPVAEYIMEVANEM